MNPSNTSRFHRKSKWLQIAAVTGACILASSGCTFLLATRLIAAIAPHSEPETGIADRIKVTGGTIEGIRREDGIHVFKGVPFAAPPIGELRWKAPQPVKPWNGVRMAKDFGPAPMQPSFDKKPSEDCLYLNVWTPAKDTQEQRPVMVYIYGGAFNGGMTSDPLYDGTNFAKKGVVLVSIAHRVGIFGFLAHSELSAESGKGSGAYGIQDQIAALRWVKENIARFGGDPKRVTVFGQSSGGISVGMLAQAPAARGLFQRAISQSGGSMNPTKPSASKPGGLVRALPLAEEDGKRFLASLKVDSIRAARNLSAEAVMKGNAGLPWPVADGATILEDPYDAYQAGRFNDTPVLIGFNSNDGGLLGSPRQTPEEFEKSAHTSYGGAADKILAAYPHATVAEASRSARDLIRETLYGWPAWAWASLQTEKGKNRAYVYYFDFGSAQGEAGHGMEVPFVFGNLGGLFRPAASRENLAMSDTIMSYWINFAKTGNPNGPGLPEWSAFSRQEQKALILGKPVEARPMPNLEKIMAFDAYWVSVRKESRKRVLLHKKQ